MLSGFFVLKKILLCRFPPLMATRNVSLNYVYLRLLESKQALLRFTVKNTVIPEVMLSCYISLRHSQSSGTAMQFSVLSGSALLPQ